MKQETKNKTRTFVAVIVVLAIVSAVLTVGYIGSTTMMANYATQLENNYQRSVYELMTDVNNIETNLSKAVVSTGKTTRQKLFNNIYTQCTQASEDLSRLPINHESVNQTTGFINQMGGFSYYAENKLKNGEDLTDADNKSVQDLHETCVYIQKILNDFMAKNNGRYSILANTKNVADNKNSFNSLFSGMQADGVDYPTLIYDGPFSESQVKKDIKGLPAEEVSKEEAQAKLEQAFKDKKYTNLKLVGEATGIFSTYNFTFLDEQNREFYVQIAKRGGFLLTISSYLVSDADNLELTECEQKAEQFAQNLGLDVKAVWSTKVTGVAYVNLTPVINGIIIYPDMIKVKVSCNTGEILGYEAQSYAFNHVDRTLSATVSEASCRSKLNSEVSIETQKLALIPVQYGEETLCYEYKCTFNNSTYYVYFNAETGEEEQVLKIISTSSGDLLM